MSQITSTAPAMRRAAATPVMRESSRTTRMKASKGFLPAEGIGRPGAGARPVRQRLLHREGFVDQLLAVRHVLRELRVAALLREREPGLVVGVAQGDDLV